MLVLFVTVTVAEEVAVELVTMVEVVVLEVVMVVAEVLILVSRGGSESER
jgi:hypothetical protein